MAKYRHRAIRDMINDMNLAISSLFYSYHVVFLLELFCFITNTVNMGSPTVNGHNKALRVAASGRVTLMCVYVLIALLLIVICNLA